MWGLPRKLYITTGRGGTQNHRGGWKGCSSMEQDFLQKKKGVMVWRRKAWQARRTPTPPSGPEIWDWRGGKKKFYLRELVEKWYPQVINQAYIGKEGEEHFQRIKDIRDFATDWEFHRVQWKGLKGTEGWHYGMNTLLWRWESGLWGMTRGE